MFMETGGGVATEGVAGQKLGGCSDRCGGLGACATGTAHEMAESLGRAVDARDQRLFQHSEVVADMSSLLAQEHGLTQRQTAMVHMAAHLHDVGKIGIPDAILHKPGQLDPHEWAIMREHPRMGAEILRPVRVFCGRPGVCEIVLAHHERWDGSGYPHGLRGSDIPLGARIVAVADALSAMTEDRPYRRGLPPDAAFEEIARGAGCLFDPCVVRDLLSLRGAFEGLLAAAALRPCRGLAEAGTPWPAVCEILAATG